MNILGEFMALNHKDPVFLFRFFYKLTPQLIKFNIPTNDWISFPALWGTAVFISDIVNPIINSITFLFWWVYIYIYIYTVYIVHLYKNYLQEHLDLGAGSTYVCDPINYNHHIYLHLYALWNSTRVLTDRWTDWWQDR